MRRAHPSICLGSLIAGTVAIALLSLPARAGLIATASTGDFYQETITVTDAQDRAFIAHWADQKDAVWWASKNPVIRIGKFTDTDGRRILITSIQASPICGISGCPVKVKNEQGVLLDQFSACDLMEDHRVSVDGRDFLACGQRFVIPKDAVSRTKRSPDVASPATTHNIYLLQRTIPDRFDPAFQAYWKDLTNDIIWDPKAKFHHSIAVGNFTDAFGRKLTATTVYTMAVCGRQICPIRLYTETGERLAEYYGCNAKEHHRVSTDRRYFFACGQAFRIPASPELKLEGSLGNAPVDVSKSLLRKIAYDSGSTVVSPSDQIFRDYWSDKTSEINWKAPATRRAQTYNAAPDSADGRNLFLTLLLPGSENDCGDQCQLRVFNAKRTLLMDVRVCGDRTQHGVSEDRRSLIACGRTFPIP